MVKQVNVLIAAVGLTALCAIATLVLVCIQLFRFAIFPTALWFWAHLFPAICCSVNGEVDALNERYLRDTEALELDISTLGAKMDRITQHKCQAKYITPVKFQAKRGTCWDFTTLGILEQTYRRQGAENGWLKELDYVIFSEHAYGVAVIEYCR